MTFARLLFCTLPLWGLLVAAAPAPADPLAEGVFERGGLSGPVLIAAPHGGYDLFTEDIARQVAWGMGGAPYLLAVGYRTFDHPWNVNRPTQGAGLAPSQEPETPGAQAVYAAYAARVSRIAPQLYVEIHGEARPESAGAIEVAVQGIDAADLRFLQRDFAAQLTRLPEGMRRWPLKIEGLDPIHFRATAVKQKGVYRLVPRALQFELPAALRKDARARSAYAWALAGSLDALAGRLRLGAEGPPPPP